MIAPCRRHTYPKTGERRCKRCLQMDTRPTRDAAYVASRGGKSAPVLVVDSKVSLPLCDLSPAGPATQSPDIGSAPTSPTAATDMLKALCASLGATTTTAAETAPSTTGDGRCTSELAIVGTGPALAASVGLSVTSNAGGLATSPAALLAHSPLGASSAERWMKCTGSTNLINTLRSLYQYQTAADQDDPEWTADGIEAHEVGAHCLVNQLDTWQLLGHLQFPRLSPDMAVAVQSYLDLVRSFPEGDMRVEYKMHRQNLHPLYYGTLDVVVIRPGHIRIADYKNGAGVFVDAEGNVQLMYYANGLIDELDVADDTIIDMYICQPNAFTSDGKTTRMMRRTAGQLRAWLQDELLPKMRDQDPTQFAMGEHCKFCPVKMACPAQTAMVEAVQMTGALPYSLVPRMKELIKAAEQEEWKRLINGHPGTGGKLVMKKVDRVWKSGAEAALQNMYGRSAYTQPTLLSPAAISKLAFGDTLVATYAYKPDGGLVVAPMLDKRSEMRPRSATAVFGAAVQKVVDSR